MSKSTRDTESKAAGSSAQDTSYDASMLESGTVQEAPEQLKRDLSSRHINMIAIAGMIVRK